MALLCLLVAPLLLILGVKEISTPVQAARSHSPRGHSHHPTNLPPSWTLPEESSEGLVHSTPIMLLVSLLVLEIRVARAMGTPTILQLSRLYLLQLVYIALLKVISSLTKDILVRWLQNHLLRCGHLPCCE